MRRHVPWTLFYVPSTHLNSVSDAVRFHSANKNLFVRLLQGISQH